MGLDEKSEAFPIQQSVHSHSMLLLIRVTATVLSKIS